MVPIRQDPDHHQARSCLDKSTANAEQTQSGSDQTRSDRDQAAADLDQLAADLDQAASDRDLAHSGDRDAYDTSRKARERTTRARRETSNLRKLAGAPPWPPGLAAIQRQIDSAHHANGQLIAAYVDAGGFGETGDSQGRAADVMVTDLVDVLKTDLRSGESVVRLGGDELVCTISDATIETARQRFAGITAALGLTPDDGSITVGFAELAPGDSPMDLIDRADRELTAARDRQSHDREAAPLIGRRASGRAHEAAG